MLLLEIVQTQLTLSESLHGSVDDDVADVCCMALSDVLRWNSLESRQKIWASG